MKRGELSMEVIIIAAIALLVLVILSVLLLRNGTLFSSGTSCEGVGGSCQPGTDATACGDGAHKSSNACSSGYVCCIPIDKQS